MMAGMRARELMRAIDRLSYRDRMRHLAAEARRLPVPELDSLLDELVAGDSFARLTAVSLGEVARRDAVVERLLFDEEPRIRSRALAAVRSGVEVGDDVLLRLYDDAPAELRQELVRTVRQRGLADRLIDPHRERWGDRAAAPLLTGCSETTVARLLPKLGYCLAAGDWQRLGCRYPSTVLAHASEALVDDNAGREEWWRTIGWGVAGAVEPSPAQALELMERALPPNTLPAAVVDVLGRLITIDRAAVLRMLTDPGRRDAVRSSAFTQAVLRRLARYTDDEIAALGRIAWTQPWEFARLLGSLPPSRRLAVFEAVTRNLDLNQSVFTDEVLDALPHAERHRQARRMLDVAMVRDSTHLSWRVTGRLPYDDAFALLEPQVRRSEAADRAAVYSAVVEAAGRSRDARAVGQALEWSTRVRNDRDPVRQAVLQAVSALPPSLLTDDHVTALDTLLTDALEARDTSWGSTYALQRQAERAVREGAVRGRPTLLDWGLRAHARLAGQSGSAGLHGLIDGLPRGHEVTVYDALRPYLEAGAARNEFGLAFEVARAFGRRGWGLAHLHEILERAVWSNQEYTVGAAVDLWLEPPATRSERIERLLRRDVGMVRWEGAWRAVTEYRTDLLDRVFAKPGRSRRFDRDQPRWAVPARALRRWLPRQQTRYAELLAEAARDKRIPDWARVDAVRTLGRIPGTSPLAMNASPAGGSPGGGSAVGAMVGLLREFAQDPEVPIAEAALAGLAWTDRPDLVMPDLIAHAGDDRARVATYAVTRAARFVRPSALAAALRPMLDGEGVKITSRKEAARLLGELRAPGAATILAEAYETAHVDVKAAIASSVSQHLLHEPAAWPLLTAAATGPAATARVVAGRQPSSVPDRHRPAYGSLVLDVTRHPDRDIVQLAYSGLAHWGRWVPAAAQTCTTAVLDLDTPSTLWPRAAQSLVTLVPVTPSATATPAASSADAPPADARTDDAQTDDAQTAGRLVVETMRRLAELDAEPGPEHDAGAERDRPARQRLTTLAGTLTRTIFGKMTGRRTVLRETAEALAPFPAFVRIRLDLLVAAIDWTAVDTDLDELTTLVAGRPLLAQHVATAVRAKLGQDQARWNPSGLEQTAERLSAAGDLTTGLLAAGLVEACGGRLTWPPAWRTRLSMLRRHPDPDVTLAALGTQTAPE